MDRDYKILAMVMPAYGHLLPMVSFINELAKVPNFKVIFPGNECHRTLIEATKADYRHIEVEMFDPKLNMNDMRKKTPADKMMKKAIATTDIIMPKLVKIVDEENIDLVIYDFASGHGKVLKQYLHKLQNENKERKNPPPFILFSPSFMLDKNIYPNKAEPSWFETKFDFILLLKILLLMPKFLSFNKRYGLKFENPRSFLFNREELNLCCVVPELQPRAHLFEKSVVFVGSCASEELRGSKELEEPLKSFLEPFEFLNPVPLKDLKVDEEFLAKRNRIRLIYVSFGTLFNEDISVFLKIIEAYRFIGQTESNKLRLLMSTGDKTYAKFQEMIQKGEYTPQDDILMMNRVPQLDVLQRASVFITHSGQGSTSESIHYGVPMICIPVVGDQPPVGYRVADELGLGIRFDYDELSAVKIKNALVDILTDKSYLERVTLFSQISRKYDGPKIATEQVIKFLTKQQQ